MFVETVRSPGLAHLSYLVGDSGHAAVIDPRVDLDVYLDVARSHDARIDLVFETHRNEDIVSGARALAAATGAEVLHGAALDFGYGTGAEHDREERLGDIRLRVLHTPGHTDESISIAVWDMKYSDGAVAVFTGDALFVGDVGRTDFYPERAEQVAALLFDSIHEQLLPLGDQVVLYPAHGAGSVCGDAMASREISTLGHERRNNPRLQLSRDDFVRAKLDEHHVAPPYFREMERVNTEGHTGITRLPRPAPVSPAELDDRLDAGLVLVDVREPEAYAALAVPGSIALPTSLLSAYAGWLLPYDRPLGLVADRDADERDAVGQLARMGFTHVDVRLRGGLSAWATSGREVQSVPSVSARDLRTRLDRGEQLTVLDVRKGAEFDAGHVPGARHRFLGHVGDDDELADLPGPVVTFCSSGRRATVAASLLRRRGVRDVETCFGSMEAWRAIDGPVDGAEPTR